MDELCPLCLKMGLNRRIRAVQINLDEAVWMCENEECVWPFGHRAPEFLPRKVGDKWAYEWQIYKIVQKSVGPIPISTELSLYTPPVTPSSEAIVKDSTKLDISNGTLISDINSNGNNIFANNPLSNNSYAAKSDETVCRERRCTAEDRTSSAKKMPSEGTAVCDILDRTSSILPSIFDIDGDELLSNKISIKQPCVETERTVRTSAPEDTLDVRNNETIDDRADTVLETSKKSKSLIHKFKNVKGEDIIVSDTQNHIPAKGNPCIRSITKTNIDLHKINGKRFFKINVKKPPIKIKSMNVEKEKLPKRQSLENTKGQGLGSGQHTTTITVDGNLPITLSYDLADLPENNQAAGPVTSTPNPQRSKRNSTECRNKEHDRNLELRAVSPRKQLRFATKLRTGTATNYEKFNFSALKKSAPESKKLDDRTSAMLDSSIFASSTTAKVEGDREKEEKPSSVDQLVPSSCVNTPNKSTTISLNPNLSAISVEAVNSPNINPDNSAISDEPSSEHFNLNSVLDDILMEGFQNATENLNDDWLESFFASDI